MVKGMQSLASKKKMTISKLVFIVYCLPCATHGATMLTKINPGNNPAAETLIISILLKKQPKIVRMT